MARAADRRRFLIGSATLAAAWLAAGCSEAPPPGATGTAGDTLERARAEGSMRVGFANEAPYAYAESATGGLTGEAPEIARVVLAGIGVPAIEGVLTEFGSLIPGLVAGRFDVIAAGMYVLPERCKQVAFSNPTYSVGEAFVVARGNPLKLHGYADVARRSRARLGVVAGTVERGYAREAGVPEERIVVFPDAPSALEGVLAKRVDAFAGTSLTVNSLLTRAKAPGIERAVPFRDPVIQGRPVRGYGAFAFRKDDVKLIAAFDAGLARYIGTPEHQAAVKPFGFTAAELPGKITARELCKG
jgi:polar amino acid transport system substrate-binding protein